VEHPQFQGHPVPAQLERVVHVLDDQLGVIEDLHDDPIRAAAKFNGTIGRFRTRHMRNSHHGSPLLRSK
jgi:hypothetical protein